MFAATRLAEGLLVAHAILIVSFLIGASIFPVSAHDDERTAPWQMLCVVTLTAAGMSTVGFMAFLLGSLGLLSPAFITISIAAAIIVPSSVRDGAPLSWRNWARRLSPLRACWTWPTVAVYVVLLLLSFPAIIPNLSGSDPVNYHLAYAQDWANAQRLIVDPYLRTPFYANNGVLLFAVLITFGASAFLNFLTWAAGLLTALAVCACVECILAKRVPRPVSAIASVSLTLAVVLNPTFIRWFDTAYIDVTIGAFAVLAVTPLLLALKERQAAWIAASALVAGFFIGLKGSLLILTPVYAIAIVIAARSLKVSNRTTVSLVALFALSSAPWYVRNIILAGDPTPPVVNLLLHGIDGIVTREEFQAMARDLTTIRGAQIAIIPFMAFFTPLTRYFREWGVSLLFLMLYVAPAFALLRFSLGRRTPPEHSIPILVFSGLVAYWIASSSLLRYALVFYPLLAVSVAIVIDWVATADSWQSYAAAALSVVSILPSPVARQFYEDTWRGHYYYLPSDFSSERNYLDRFSDGYREATFTMDYWSAHHIGGTIYVLGRPGAYYFRQRGIVSMGDWIGPAGYYRLYRAIDAREAAPFLQNLGAKSLLVTPSSVIGGLDEPLASQLVDAGYCDMSLTDSTYHLFVLQHDHCVQPHSTNGKSGLTSAADTGPNETHSYSENPSTIPQNARLSLIDLAGHSWKTTQHMHRVLQSHHSNSEYEYVGTGTPAGNEAATLKVPVTPGTTYVFSAQVDASKIATGQFDLIVDTPNGKSSYAWTFHGAGPPSRYSTPPWTCPAGTNHVLLGMQLVGTVVANRKALIFSKPQLSFVKLTAGRH